MITKDTNVRVKDSSLTSWRELEGKIGVVKDIGQGGQRIRVFFDGIGWLDFGPDQLDILPSPQPHW